MTADLTTTRAGAGAAVPGPAGPEAPARVRLSSPGVLASVGLHVAAGGHVVAALEHLSHGWGYAVLFLSLAAAQVAVAGRVARGAGPRLVGVVLAATLGLVLLYLASRTVNLPFGGVHTANNDRPQDPDLAGTVVVTAELLVLAVLPAFLPATARRWATNAMLAIGVGLWAAWATGTL